MLDYSTSTGRAKRFLLAIARRRGPDFVIGGRDSPYLRRWWVIPRNPFLNIYLHQFLRSDDDRARHDHPWLANASWLIAGGYREWITDELFVERHEGEFKLRWGPAPHRVELTEGPCWTVFITGPRVREWGFYCGKRVWIHWKRFTAPTDKGSIGAGCDA